VIGSAADFHSGGRSHPSINRRIAHTLHLRLAKRRELGHTGVVQIGQLSSAAAAALSPGQTRDSVARLIVESGPISAAQIAHELGLTPAGIRRHLDALVADGYASTREARPTAKRGRPAREYVLTDAGHAQWASSYGDLATSAMSFLAEQLCPQAIREFAQRRVADLEARYAPQVAAAGPELTARTDALAQALSRDGYAASTRQIPGGAGLGHQLCQGHCPVQQVAEQFPELCEAETDVISRLLGVHVQRLATLATGAHVCTTHIPSTPSTQNAHSSSLASPQGRKTS
jgi:predicted ArsR family transcriptional regulator